MDYMSTLKKAKAKNEISDKLYGILEEFYRSFSEAMKESGESMEAYEDIVNKYLEETINESLSPFQFELFHQAIRSPYDYYHFGLNLFRPLVIFEKSKIHHPNHLKEIETVLEKGENVILLANHQIEPDPQIIGLMLENEHPHLAEKMIFVAGHRVINDPSAIPLSKGCNLLCIYSKKHIENPPELKLEKQRHNQRTMHRMSELLAEGGKCIYVAPSGGRDREDPLTGQVEIAPFDSQSIEMFWLMAQHSGKPTHFYPLTLSTYHVMPPPKTVEKDLGEKRSAKRSPVHLSFGAEINMTDFPGSEGLDKKNKRLARANYIWRLVKEEFQKLI